MSSLSRKATYSPCAAATPRFRVAHGPAFSCRKIVIRARYSLASWERIPRAIRRQRQLPQNRHHLGSRPSPTSLRRSARLYVGMTTEKRGVWGESSISAALRVAELLRLVRGVVLVANKPARLACAATSQASIRPASSLRRLISSRSPSREARIAISNARSEPGSYMRSVAECSAS